MLRSINVYDFSNRFKRQKNCLLENIFNCGPGAKTQILTLLLENVNNNVLMLITIEITEGGPEKKFYKRSSKTVVILKAILAISLHFERFHYEKSHYEKSYFSKKVLPLKTIITVTTMKSLT